MDKGLTLPKWVLINRLKITQIPKIYLPKLSTQAHFDEKRLHWESVVRDTKYKDILYHMIYH
jgi:hypothetical protein